jgi:protein gp37
MALTTGIEWTDATWNPWYGCKKVSPGCKGCYAERDMHRYGRDFSVVTRSKTTFNHPLLWREPARVFTCSWSDFFIEDADGWRDEAWNVIRKTPRHTYQILTKRPHRIAGHLPADWPFDNVWLGTSVENCRHGLPRIDFLRAVPARVRFLSIEPLLEHIPASQLNLDGIHWVIVGGESGPAARPMEADWVWEIRDLCIARDVPFFFAEGRRPGAGRCDVEPIS